MSPRPPARTGLGAIDAERFDVASAVGGWRGVMESAAPTFVFVVVMAVRPSALVTALAASLAVSGAALAARLAQRQGLTQGREIEERRVGKECRSRWSPYH